MGTSRNTHRKANPIVEIGFCSILIVGVMSAGFLNAEISSSQKVTTGEVLLPKEVDDSYEQSIASGFIAEHIGISSGLDPEGFSEYSTDLSRTLIKLTSEQRNDVFRGVAAYENDIFASE